MAPLPAHGQEVVPLCRARCEFVAYFVATSQNYALNLALSENFLSQIAFIMGLRLLLLLLQVAVSAPSPAFSAFYVTS